MRDNGTSTTTPLHHYNSSTPLHHPNDTTPPLHPLYSYTNPTLLRYPYTTTPTLHHYDTFTPLHHPYTSRTALHEPYTSPTPLLCYYNTPTPLHHPYTITPPTPTPMYVSSVCRKEKYTEKCVPVKKIVSKAALAVFVTQTEMPRSRTYHLGLTN